MSYNGGINFGLLADYDSIDDLDLLTAGIERAIAELTEPPRRLTRAPEASEEPRARLAGSRRRPRHRSRAAPPW